MQVADVMHTDVKTAGAEDTFADVAKTMRTNGISSVVVLDGRKLAGRIIGLSDTDLRLLTTEGHDSGEHVIRYADIASIKQKGSRTALWIALGVGIGILLPIGLCAASA